VHEKIKCGNRKHIAFSKIYDGKYKVGLYNKKKIKRQFKSKFAS